MHQYAKLPSMQPTLEKKERSRQGKLFLIRVIAILGILTGIVLLLRGWGLAQNQNNFVAENSTIKRNPLPINTILSISGLSIPPVGGASSNWADKITTHPGLPTTQGIWLLQTKNNSTIVNEFTQAKIDILLNIPQNILQTKLFSTGQTMALTQTNAGVQQLIGTNPTDSKSLIKLFEFTSTQNVVSTYLVPKYQEIYFAWGSRSSKTSNISVIKPTGEVLPVYNSNAYQIRQILTVNLTTSRLDFSAVLAGQTELNCYRLNIQNNTVNEIVCASVNIDGFAEGFGLLKNDRTAGTDIYKYNYQSQNPELFRSAETGQSRRLLTRSGSVLLWLNTDLGGIEVVQSYNLATRELKTHASLPVTTLMQLTLIQGKIVLLGQTENDSYRIYIEDDTVSSSFSSVASATSAISTISTTSEPSTSSSQSSSASSETSASISSAVSISSLTAASSASSPNSASSTSSDESGFTLEQLGAWKMYTVNGCAQNCRLEILKY